MECIKSFTGGPSRRHLPHRSSARHRRDQAQSHSAPSCHDRRDGGVSAWMSIVSKATVATIGLASKLFLNSGYCSSVKVNGIHNLLNELGRKDGRGVITGESVFSWGFSSSRLTRGSSCESPLNVRLLNPVLEIPASRAR